MTGVACFCCLTSLMLLSGVPSTDQLPMRAKDVDQRPLPKPEDAGISSDVVPDTPNILENIGVEPSQGYLIEGDIRVWHGFPLQERTNARTTISHSHEQGFSQDTNSHQIRNTVPAEETWLERVIPYEIDTIFNSTERQIIHDAMYEIMAAVNNCTVFVKRETQEDFVYITGQQLGCYSDVGKKGGNQTVSISRASQCVSKGIVMHELLHALGFWHEHNRPDRDKYIEILNNNIRIGHAKDFKINHNGNMLVEYDYYSIMHYKINQFSKDHLSMNTIRILQAGVDETNVGQRMYLSDKDKERIIRLYQCRKFLRSVNNATQSSQNLGFQGIQNSALLTPQNFNGSEQNVQKPLLTTVHSEVPAKDLSVTATVNINNQENVSKSNITETAEVGRK